MAEHSDLISEMPFLEKLNTEERLKLARKRRSQQLKKWSQREKEHSLTNKRKKADEVGDNRTDSKNVNYKVHFVPSVMLLEAATRNDVDEVKRLLMLGVSPDSTNEDGLTALHQCCIDNCEEMMQLLIEFGANVNAKDSEQWTPLHAAATCGHLHLIKILIDKGADLLAVNADGNMPYDICEDEQTLDYIESEMAKRGITQELIDDTRSLTENQMLNDMKRLVENGFDLNFKYEQSATPLHIAAANGYMSVVEYLLDNNASTEECDDDLWQPIHAAACWGHIDIIEYLVQNGADLDAKTKNGETPFDICEDPDLKSRILQLRSELESKRAVSSNRLRRSHSQNTRSHSIRRTSIREKSQIAKREAIEEARIWQEKAIEPIVGRKEEGDFENDAQYYNIGRVPTDSPIELNKIDLKLDNIDSDYRQPVPPYNVSLSSSHDNYHDKPPQTQSSVKHTPQSTRYTGADNYYSNYYYQEYQEQQSYLENGSDSRSANDTSDSVKVEIHVTVNTTGNGTNQNQTGSHVSSNTGTLIDLKKQRSEKHRNSLNNIYPDRMKPPLEPTVSQGSTVSNVSNTSNRSNVSTTIPKFNLASYQTQHLDGSQDGDSASSAMPIALTGTNSKHSHSNVLFETPPSPSSVKKKFRGNPSEIIGEENKKGCCTIC